MLRSVNRLNKSGHILVKYLHIGEKEYQGLVYVSIDLTAGIEVSAKVREPEGAAGVCGRAERGAEVARLSVGRAELAGARLVPVQLGHSGR